MPYKFNPFTNRLDFYESGGGGGGDVVGPASSTAGDFAIFADNTGKLLADRPSPLEVPYGGTGQDNWPAHSIPIGDGTNPIAFRSPTATVGAVLQCLGMSTDPAYSNASYPSGATEGDLIYGSASNVYSQLAIGSEGQVLTVVSGVPDWATPTGVTAWVDVTASPQTLDVNVGYLANVGTLLTFTLPATAAQFSQIKIRGYGAGGWTIAQNAGQQILFGNTQTTAGVTGSLSSTNARDSVTLLAAVGGSSTIWIVEDSIGNLTVV